MTPDDYRAIAARVDSNTDLHRLDFSDMYTAQFECSDIEVFPKERPRSGKGGRMFTPAKTRDTEKKIAKWGKEQGMEPVTFPVGVDLTIRDVTKDNALVEHSLMGLVFRYKRDLDNMAKLVLDALNGVLYKDDNQIVDLRVTRRYDSRPGFYLVVWRAGLSDGEYTNLKKFM